MKTLVKHNPTMLDPTFDPTLALCLSFALALSLEDPVADGALRPATKSFHSKSRFACNASWSGTGAPNPRSFFSCPPQKRVLVYSGSSQLPWNILFSAKHERCTTTWKSQSQHLYTLIRMIVARFSTYRGCRSTHELETFATERYHKIPQDIKISG